MPAEIRQYREADRTALVACLKELQQHIALLDDLKRSRLAADFDGEAYTRRLLEKIDSQYGAIFLAEDTGTIIGCVAGIIPEQTEDDAFEGYPSKDGRVLELYVHPSQRGKQLGLGLMRAMENYFRASGCKGCRVDCFALNVDTHEFYLKLGYVDRLTTLLKLL